MKKAIAIIPSRYGSSRFPGKPLANICGRPMLWWVYNQVKKVEELDDVIVATDDDRIAEVCMNNSMKYIMTSTEHNTPTSRMYEVSKTYDSDIYVFVGGDEPLIEPEAIAAVVQEAQNNDFEVTHAMTKIKTSPEVIDFTNIKVVVGTRGTLLYTTRSPIPFPKGGLDFDYMKFVGIGAFTKRALDFYNDTPKSLIEKIEECDLLRFIDKGIEVKMIEVNCRNVSVDTPKDLELVKEIMKKKIETGE